MHEAPTSPASPRARSPQWQLPRVVERLALAGAVGCLIALPLLALLPADYVERTGAGKNIEHFTAYLGTGLLLGIALWDMRHRLLATLGLVVLAGVLEIAQGFTATRSSELAQFLASAAGAVASLPASVIARWVIQMVVDRLTNRA